MTTQPDELIADVIETIPPAERTRSAAKRPAFDIEAAFGKIPKPKGRIIFWMAIGWIALVLFGSIFADLLPLKAFDAIVSDLPARTAPGWRADFLGTDVIGRSVLSRVIYGARESMLVAGFSVAIAMVVGLVLGIVAGFFRGPLDEGVGVVTDAVLSIPALVLLLAVAAVGKRDLLTLVIGLGIVGIPSFARLARAATLSLADRNYVTASRVMGATRSRIMLRELLPDVILRVSSFAFLFMAFVVVAEGSLSFLGLGIPPPNPSWGGMINDGRSYLQTQAYLVFVPAACMFFTVAAFTIVGDRARRRFDTKGSMLQ